MTQRLAIAATAGLIAFVIVLLSAVGAYVLLAPPAAPAGVPVSAAGGAGADQPPPGATSNEGAAPGTTNLGGRGSQYRAQQRAGSHARPAPPASDAERAYRL